MPSFDAGQTGITPGVTILTAAGAVHTARATAGITEAIAGSGVYHFAHPAPGTLLLFVFDQGAGTVGASVWDDGLTTIPARAGDAMTLTAAYDHSKDDVLTPLGGLATATALAEVGGVVDGIAVDYAKTGEAAAAITGIPASVDIRLSETHGVGSWESNQPTTGALVTQLSVGDDGLPLGRIMPYGTISVYLGAELHYRFDEIADADGDFVLTLPYGSTWTLVAENPPNYRSTTAVITIPPLP